MKTLKYFCLIIAGTGLLLSCTEDELLLSDQEDISLEQSCRSHMSKYIVEPNGIDDTENLKAAFADAQNNSNHSTVQLTEGVYHINFMEIREFSGAFRGAGIDRTVITAVEELNFEYFEGKNLNTVLLRFIGGTIQMSDMTFSYQDENAPLVNGVVGISSQTSEYISQDEYVKAVVNHVNFLGNRVSVRNGLKAETGYAEGEGIPLSDIDISITNCSFTDFAWYGALIMELREGHVIAGSLNNGNTFNNCPLGIWHNTSMKLTAQSNTFNCQGLWFGMELFSAPYDPVLQQLPQTFQSECAIEKNTFNISQCTGGLIVNDNRRIFYPEELPMIVSVKNNRFNADEETQRVLVSMNTDGMMIRNNRFTGGGALGVLIRQQEDAYNENGLMLGNNFSNTSYSLATIHLTTLTRNWTIIGANQGETIIDEGTDNIIKGSGMSHMKGLSKGAIDDDHTMAKRSIY